MSIKWQGVLGYAKTIRAQGKAGGVNIDNSWINPSVIISHQSGGETLEKACTLSAEGIFEVVVEPSELTLFGEYDVTFLATDPDSKVRAFPEGPADQLLMREA